MAVTSGGRGPGPRPCAAAGANRQALRRSADPRRYWTPHHPSVAATLRPIPRLVAALRRCPLWWIHNPRPQWRRTSTAARGAGGPTRRAHLGVDRAAVTGAVAVTNPRPPRARRSRRRAAARPRPPARRSASRRASSSGDGGPLPRHLVPVRERGRRADHLGSAAVAARCVGHLAAPHRDRGEDERDRLVITSASGLGHSDLRLELRLHAGLQTPLGLTSEVDARRRAQGSRPGEYMTPNSGRPGHERVCPEALRPRPCSSVPRAGPVRRRLRRPALAGWLTEGRFFGRLPVDDCQLGID